MRTLRELAGKLYVGRVAGGDRAIYHEDAPSHDLAIIRRDSDTQALADLFAASPDLFAMVEEGAEKKCRCTKNIKCFPCRCRIAIAKARPQ